MKFTFTKRLLALLALAFVAQTSSADTAFQELLVGEAADTHVFSQAVSDASPAEVQLVSATAFQNEPYADQNIATLESRIASLESNASGRHSCQPNVVPSTRVSTNCIGCPVNYAGFDFAILKPNVGAISGAIPPLAIAGSVTSTMDFDLAPRVYFGRERADGLGFRATYFNFDDTSDPSDLGVETGLELHTLDLEVTSRLKFCGSDLLLSTGFRYADVNQSYELPGLGSLEFDSDGAGLTVGGRYTRSLGQTAWDLSVSGRASLLLTDNELAIPGLVSVVAEESTMKIWEAKVGVSRSRELASGALFVSEFAFETQNWDAAAIAGIIGNEFSLYGPTFRFGINR
ncbi:hypothetical protein [Planctomycetes bacterium K23_9]|uniref:Uncharacterized protein n=1 Tax=Stieleria marina TaxID=1930275 RepID=A0A517NX89_9BACT|nr:hypothetical protein K239x_37500 [Planctomycetes bacterium K23_9]